MIHCAKTHLIFALFWVFCILGISVYNYDCFVNKNLIQTDILAILPHNSSKQIEQVQSFMQDNQFQDRILILIGHKDKSIAKKYFLKLRHFLKDVPILEQSSKKIGEKYKDLFKKLYPFRHGLIHPDDFDSLKSDMSFFTQRALSYIASPLTIGTINLKEDPFFLFSSFVQKAIPSSCFEMDENQDIFINHQETTWYVFHAFVPDGAFSLDVQKEIIQTLDPFLKDLSVHVQVLKTGALFYAAAGFNQANQEMSTLGLLSVICIFLAIFLYFRSIFPIFMSLIVIFSALSVGLFVCLFVFKTVHIIALLFGCSLIGITVDYVIHYCVAANCHTPSNDRLIVFKSLMPALLLAALSSAAGYGVLGFLPFPGLQQMALMASFGILTAFICVFFWAPYLIKNKTHHCMPLKNFQKRFDVFASYKSVRIILTVFIVSFFSLGFKNIQFNDDIKSFQTLNPVLKGQEEKIKAIMPFDQPKHFVVFNGPTQEDVLIQEEQFIQKNKNLIQRALSFVIPSKKNQLDHQKAISDLYNNQFDLLKSFLGINIQPPLIENNVFELDSLDILPDGLKQLIRREENGTYTLRTILIDEDLSLKDVFYVHPIKAYNNILREYREQILRVSLVFFVLIYMILAIFLKIQNPKEKRYLKKSLSILGPIFLALIATSASIHFFGESFSLFHFMGAFLVACLGLDYALFLYFKDEQSMIKHTQQANFVCMVTTLFSFGFLAFSQTKAIHDFGVFVFLGIILCFILTTFFLRSEKLK